MKSTTGRGQNKRRLTKLFKLTMACAGVLLLATGTAGAEQDALLVKSIDKSRWPLMRVDLSLATTEKVTDFKLTEDGKPAKLLKVTSHSKKQPVSVTLLIDVSGSMRGKPLEDAKAAAKIFIISARPRDKIALVVFSTGVKRLVDFTTDKFALAAAVDGLQATGETAVFDALKESLNAAGGQPEAHKSVILLTDGGDTASQASGGEISELAKTVKVPVSAIALESDEFDPAPIEQIAAASGGRLLTAPSSQSLATLYNGLAAELHNRYQLVYRSRAKKTHAQLNIVATAGGQNLGASIKIEGLPYKPPAAKRPGPDAYAKALDAMNAVSHPWLAAALAFIAAALAGWALSNLFIPSQNTLGEQLKYYDQLRGNYVGDPTEPLYIRAHERLTDIVRRASAKGDFAAYAQTKLEQAGLPVKPNEYMALHILVVAAVSFATTILISDRFTMMVIILGAVVGPLMAIRVKIEQRRSKFRAQLPDTLDRIASSMRAGFGIQQAIASTADEAREPTASELQRVSNQVRYGMTLEKALERTAARVGDASFRWVVMGVAIHRETGGNLAEILDNLAATLRQREAVKRQIKTLSAEGRLSAVILAVLPLVEGGILFSRNPKYMAPLTTTLPGLLMLSIGIILLVTGILWMRKVARVEY